MKILRAILYIVAAILWISGFIYIVLAHKNENFAVNWYLFAIFFATVLIFLVPALMLSMPQALLNIKRVFLASWFVFIGILWTFGTLYFALTLNITDRASLLLLATNFGWEVPILATFFAYYMYRKFKKIMKMPDKRAAYDKLFLLPGHAARMILTITVIGVIIGTASARLFIGAPWVEVIKAVTALATIGLLAAMLIFFVLQDVLQPWIKSYKPKHSHL